MMRYAWLSCRDSSHNPFAIYVTFNRYFRLEPLLSTNSNALHQFHSWVLARIVLALFDSLAEWKDSKNAFSTLVSEVPLDAIKVYVNRVERNLPLDPKSSEVAASLTIETVQNLISSARRLLGRKYTILLMDDAALTLAPDFLIEFLDIVRSLKSIDIAPKASVYPGTTEVSYKFHEGQDSISIPVWLCVEDPNYNEIMDDIAQARVSDFQNINASHREMLRFAAFGIPRAYLTMLEEYRRGGFRSSQQAINQIIQDHLDARNAEFRSLGKKVPKIESLVIAGEQVLNGIVAELKSFNGTIAAKKLKQLTYGVSELEMTAIVERMFNLLVEAGLIFENGTVKHGTPTRIYHRFIPHTAHLLTVRALGGSGAGGTINQTVEAIAFKSAKHPVRKSLKKVAHTVDLDGLTLSLPKCSSCDTRRLTDNQRFCHVCGQQLVDASTFSLCLETFISDVPGLTAWQKDQISQHLPLLKTLRDFLAKQDPAADLLTVRGFGRRRTAKIVDVLNGFADDFLS
ncbi:zinc ribbon domain-containing protein [Pseudomonas sp. DY-1]|uniref:zinc ribbon domain-containing protein n=1 Tax=Pseudomonas sp. DY-1 TaxID=1755504 RepID=UPI0013C49D87|nr:zinc ribbon domain-containing protein [Pseudomonas sp. DY-1]